MDSVRFTLAVFERCSQWRSNGMGSMAPWPDARTVPRRSARSSCTSSVVSTCSLLSKTRRTCPTCGPCSCTRHKPVPRTDRRTRLRRGQTAGISCRCAATCTGRPGPPRKSRPFTRVFLLRAVRCIQTFNLAFDRTFRICRSCRNGAAVQIE